MTADLPKTTADFVRPDRPLDRARAALLRDGLFHAVCQRGRRDVSPLEGRRGRRRRSGGFGAHPAIADSVQMTYMRPEHGDLTIHGKLVYDEIVDPDSYNEGADPDQIVKNAELIAHRFPLMEHGLAMGGYSGSTLRRRIITRSWARSRNTRDCSWTSAGVDTASSTRR